MKTKIKKQKLQHQEIPIDVTNNSKLLHLTLILISFITSLYIRIVPPYDRVFNNPTGTITFAADDAVMHMRIVENLVINFPHKIWFEAFTLFPYGQPIHFGPLQSYMIAIPALILGMGDPSLELIRTIGAFYPAIMGALVIFPVYVIGKEVFNRRVGVLAAMMIAVMPGPFLTRSMLGFTDHHVGEVFFSSLFIMFFILAMKSVHNDQNTTINIKNLKSIKTYNILSIIAGISFGLYMLQWTSGVFLGGIIALTMFIHIIREHLVNKPIGKICLVTTLMFLSAFFMIIFVVKPFNNFEAGRYSFLHVLITFGSATFFMVLYLISTYLDKKDKRNLFPMTIISIFGAVIISVRLILPKAFAVIPEFFGMFSQRTGGYITIAEAMGPSPGYIQHAFPGVISYFSCFNLTLIGMIIICLLLLKNWEIKKWIFVVWSLTIFALTLGQIRWFYYYAVNVALVSSYIGICLLDLSGHTKLTDKLRKHETDFQTFYDQNLSQIATVLITGLLVLLILIAPLYTASSKTTMGGVASSDYFQWHDSLTWMRYNTPNPGIDFNTSYPYNNIPFEYPKEAYGVMSWWDYGHVITYIGHRIPNANPFQAGIGGGPDHTPGASSFFTALSEDEATEILYQLGIDGKPGSKYIISNAYMAYSINNVMGIWNNYENADYYTWAIISGEEQPVYTEFWYENMESKLHIFDGNGLKQYRLVHESIPNPYANGGHSEQRCKALYNLLYDGNIQIENTGFVKIFEVVNGTTVTGTAPINSPVTISNTILTNQGRTFSYSQTTMATDGTYKFIVPYSTLGPIETETNFDTKPVGAYSIESNYVSTQLHINEYDILNGSTIIVNLQ